MATWPASLPQRVLLDGYAEGAADNVLRFETDYGPPKRRRRSTREVRTFPAALVLTTAQVATLDTFYTSTLGQVDAFDWVHPRTLAAASFKFEARPDIRPLGGGYWRATFVLIESW